MYIQHNYMYVSPRVWW